MIMSERRFVTVSGYEKALPATEPTAAMQIVSTTELEIWDGATETAIWKCVMLIRLRYVL